MVRITQAIDPWLLSTVPLRVNRRHSNRLRQSSIDHPSVIESVQTYQWNDKWSLILAITKSHLIPRSFLVFTRSITTRVIRSEWRAYALNTQRDENFDMWEVEQNRQNCSLVLDIGHHFSCFLIVIWSVLILKSHRHWRIRTEFLAGIAEMRYNERDMFTTTRYPQVKVGIVSSLVINLSISYLSAASDWGEDGVSAEEKLLLKKNYHKLSDQMIEKWSHISHSTITILITPYLWQGWILIWTVSIRPQFHSIPYDDISKSTYGAHVWNQTLTISIWHWALI